MYVERERDDDCIITYVSSTEHSHTPAPSPAHFTGIRLDVFDCLTRCLQKLTQVSVRQRIRHGFAGAQHYRRVFSDKAGHSGIHSDSQRHCCDLSTVSRPGRSTRLNLKRAGFHLRIFRKVREFCLELNTAVDSLTSHLTMPLLRAGSRHFGSFTSQRSLLDDPTPADRP